MAGNTQGGDGYHHGDLRATLLVAAVELIAERGAGKLSLRECARRAGVSHAAPYRHFANKDALLQAIAEEGFGWLYAAGVEAMEGIEDARDRLDAYGLAYVRFAIEHPVHVRVMFTLQFDVKGGEDKGAPAFELLEKTAAEAAGEDADPQVAAVAAWALPHGLSMLILDGRIPPEHVGDAEAVEVLAKAVYGMWRGALGR